MGPEGHTVGVYTHAHARTRVHTHVHARIQVDRQLSSIVLTLCRATLLIGKPSIVREDSANKAAIMSEVQRTIGELYQKIRDAALDTASESVKAAPDVTDAEWDQFKDEIGGMHEQQLQASHLLKSWYRWSHMRGCNRARARARTCARTYRPARMHERVRACENA